jgi:hypothetical protein
MKYIVSRELKVNLLVLVPVGGCADTDTGAGFVWMSDLWYIGKHHFSIYKIINIYKVQSSTS